MRAVILAIAIAAASWTSWAVVPSAKVEQGLLKGTIEDGLSIYRGSSTVHLQLASEQALFNLRGRNHRLPRGCRNCDCQDDCSHLRFPFMPRLAHTARFMATAWTNADQGCQRPSLPEWQTAERTIY